ATLVASGVFFGVAFAEQSRAQNRQLMLSNGNLQPQGVEQYNNALANRDSFRAVGTVSALGGALALAGGVALFAFDRPDPNSVPIRSPEGPRNKPKSDFEVAAAPLFSEGTYGLGAIGRF
ncbi:MAG TPA: hypothetical protein PK141_20080, partial [Polyangiaceae bacterium]|nr:hypothetical protein [Polyangiaceae bacterium]